MFSTKAKKKNELWIDQRFDALFGEEFRGTYTGAKCLETFRQWMRAGRCVLVSTIPQRRGMVALKVSIRQAVKLKVS